MSEIIKLPNEPLALSDERQGLETKLRDTFGTIIQRVPQGLIFGLVENEPVGVQDLVMRYILDGAKLKISLLKTGANGLSVLYFHQMKLAADEMAAIEAEAILLTAGFDVEFVGMVRPEFRRRGLAMAAMSLIAPAAADFALRLREFNPIMKSRTWVHFGADLDDAKKMSTQWLEWQRALGERANELGFVPQGLQWGRMYDWE